MQTTHKNSDFKLVEYKEIECLGAQCTLEHMSTADHDDRRSNQLILDCCKEYDIRGLVGKELNFEIAYKLGQLFSHNINYQSVVVAKDNRLHSKTLLNGLIQGLLSCGCKVIELEGVSSSPLLYFASFHLKTTGAIMVTGSHNPLEYNGFKFMLDQKSFYGESLKSIVNNPVIAGVGKHIKINLDDEYSRALPKTRSLKVGWECNNSAVGRILKKLGENLLLNSELNGNFTHIPPDPCIKKNLKQIKEFISKESCDFGFAFDGDGDRLVLIKNDGQALTGDQLIYLLATSLKNHPNKKILIDVKASQILIDTLIADGFEVIIAPSGHSLMKTRVIEEKALLAGELSGHFVINDGKFYPVDDALYAALRLLEYLQHNQLIELPLAPIAKEFRIPKVPGLDPQIYKPEGLRKSYDGGFYLIRASNTEDYILVKYEAMNEKLSKIIESELKLIL